MRPRYTTALCDRMAIHKVCIVKGLRDTDFGLRCFVFADPDGNRIDVGEPIATRDDAVIASPLI